MRVRATVLQIIFLILWVFSSVVVSQVVVGLLMVLLLGQERACEPIWSGVYSVLSYGVSLFLTFLVLPKLSKKYQTSREELGISGWPTWTDIGLAPVGLIASLILAAGLTAIFSLIPWFNATEAQDTGFSIMMSGGERVVAFVILVVVAPVVEELIFRGWLYGKLRARAGVAISTLITSLLFGVMHFQWNVGVTVFALSVVLCALREITGTIYAGILTHMLKNGVAFFLLYVLGM